MLIRATTPKDHRRLLTLHRAAFEEEDLRPLVSALLEEPGVISLAAGLPGEPIAHLMLTPCTIGAGPGASKAMLLGPVAVAPEQQGQGTGEALIRAALTRLASQGKPPVLVLGSPDYYGRFEFRQETNVTPPYPLPEGWGPAWQSLDFDGRPLPAGALTVPGPWREQSLWRDG